MHGDAYTTLVIMIHAACFWVRLCTGIINVHPAINYNYMILCTYSSDPSCNDPEPWQTTTREKTPSISRSLFSLCLGLVYNMTYHAWHIQGTPKILSSNYFTQAHTNRTTSLLSQLFSLKIMMISYGYAVSLRNAKTSYVNHGHVEVHVQRKHLWQPPQEKMETWTTNGQQATVHSAPVENNTTCSGRLSSLTTTYSSSYIQNLVRE